MTGGQITVRFRGLVALGVAACLVLLVWVLGDQQGASDGTTPGSSPTEPPPVPSPADVLGSRPASGTPAAPGPSRGAPDTGASENPEVLLVVGAAASPNDSERGIRERLGSRGYRVTLADDEAAMTPDLHSLVIVSKTVTSTEIGDRFKGTTAGVLTWEDNAQAIEQEGEVDVPGSGAAMLAWIDLVNPEGTSWHARDTIWDVDPGAPAVLRAGLSGAVPIYRTRDEMTYAPAGTLAGNATAVARFGSDDDRVAYYVYDRDTRLPDGTLTAGRRVYFGLYDDTFASLTDAGLRLFDAAVDWGAGVSG